jgi:hypothetical protein
VLALLSPLVAGAVWVSVALPFWMNQMDSPEANLGTMVAFWAVLFYGFVGLIVLIIPMVVGLVSRVPITRLAAAWVEAGICALVAALWFISTVPGRWHGWGGPFDYFSIAALLVPLVVTGVLTPRVMRTGVSPAPR